MKHLLRPAGTPLTVSLLVLCAAAQGLVAQTMPVRGRAIPELSALDTAMVNFMTTNQIRAGSLGVIRDGDILMQRSYGWLDANRTKPLPVNGMMRIASITKPLTAAAIRKLAAAKKFTLSSKVFDVGQKGGGLLKITPFRKNGPPVYGDARLGNITVQHLLDHQGGWDRNTVGDWLFFEIPIAYEMCIQSPPSRMNMARWILGQPLQFTPGTKRVYSNVGYLMLGLIIEKYAGTDYTTYVYREVFRGLPIDRADIEQGRTFKAQQNPREPLYDDSGLALNVFNPTKVVNVAYGGWHHEGAESVGAVISTTGPLLHFLANYYIAGPNIGAPRAPRNSGNWTHSGSIPGTSTIAHQRRDGLAFVVLFNKRCSNCTHYAVQMRNKINGLLNGITKWPASPPKLSFAGVGCAANTVLPVLGAAPPFLGETQTYGLHDTKPNSATYLLIAAGGPQPLTLGQGCVLQPHAGSMLVLPAGTTGARGRWAGSFKVPSSTTLIGVAVTVQAFTQSAGGPALGIGQLSNGLAMKIGG